MRASTVDNVLAKSFKTFQFTGAWKEFIGEPERKGIWFIWGGSGNGKTSFVMQLSKELCKFDKVLLDSLEEGTSLTMKNSLERFGMRSVGRRLHLVDEHKEELFARLRKKKSYNIVIIDSYQYFGLTKDDYKAMKKAFSDKLIIFTSHQEGKDPTGASAKFAMYDATLKIRVEGYRALSKGRFFGEKGYYSIWPEKEKEYWK